MCGLTEEHFRRLHHGFGQRRMRVDGQLEVGGVRAHLDAEDAFGNQFAGARTDEADAEQPFGVGVEHELRQTIRPIERDRPA